MKKEQAETSRKATDNILSAADNPVANDLEMPLSSSKVPTGRRERINFPLICLSVL